jgi:hypothetical protein
MTPHGRGGLVALTLFVMACGSSSRSEKSAGSAGAPVAGNGGDTGGGRAGAGAGRGATGGQGGTAGRGGAAGDTGEAGSVAAGGATGGAAAGGAGAGGAPRAGAGAGGDVGESGASGNGGAGGDDALTDCRISGCPPGMQCLPEDGRCGGVSCQSPDPPPCVERPVCGCDGNLYPSNCAARSAGVALQGVIPIGGGSRCMPPAGYFDCLGLLCDSATEYCDMHRHYGSSNFPFPCQSGDPWTAAACHPLPAACDPDPSCACITEPFDPGTASTCSSGCSEVNGIVRSCASGCQG